MGTEATGASGAFGAPRRRNGRQQACEPCRKRKVACDHRLPVCSRCKRGKIASSCVYLAAAAARSPPTPSSRLGLVVPHASTSSLTPSSDTFSPPSDSNVGYLGATSFSAVFREAQNSLPPTDPTPATPDECQGVGAPRSRLMLDDRTCETALGILYSIPDRKTCHALFKKYVNPLDGWCRLAVAWLIESLWTSFGAALESDRSQQSLAHMALLLCRNSSKSLREDHTDPQEWFRSFSGPNLRWESLGILFTYWALGAEALPETSSQDGSLKLGGSDPDKLMRRCKASSWSCVDICRNAASGNTLLLYLLYKQGILESIVHGDTSMQNCRIHGETIALTTFLGLHASSSSDLHDRSISTQIKRRLFSVIFNLDKVLATFTGRPPLLGRRFSSTPLPLDMSDEAFLGTTWESAVDKNGWSTSGHMYSTTIMRARTMMAVIRDSILDIALRATGCGGREILLDLKRQETDVVAQFPACIVYRAGDVTNRAVDGPTLYAKLLVRLEHLQNLFFIERLLDKDSDGPSPRMLEISLDMVSLTLIFWTHQDRLSGLQGDFEWLVMSFAAPAGGVLCLELLKASGPSSSSAMVNRSSIIQQLSLLVGFLDWVSPTAPNGDLCHSVKKVVSHVLDQALNHMAGQSSAVVDVGDWGMERSADMNDFFSFDLLDTFDWLRPDQ